MQKDYPGMVFACTSMSDTTITMVHKPPLEQETQVDVPFADLGKWKVTRCHMAKVCPAPTVEPLLPQNVPYCQEERLRLQATLALHEAHDKHQVNLCDQPHRLVHIAAFEKGQGAEAGSHWQCFQSQGITTQGCYLDGLWWIDLANPRLEAIPKF